MTIINEMTSLVPKLRENRCTVAPLATLVCGAVVLHWITHGTQFHQLAIGIAMSAITLTVALALFEFCWRVGLFVAMLFGSQNRN